MFKAVFFDMDDTLCDFTSSERQARRIMCEEVARDYNLDSSLVEEAYRTISLEALKRHPNMEVNLSLWPTVQDFRAEAWGRVFSKLGLRNYEPAPSLAAQHERIRREHLRLYPDALPILNALHGRFHLVLVSNGPADVQRDEANLLGLSRFFETMLFEGELGFGKPDRKVFDLALSHARSAPAEAIFVGDSLLTDVQGAKGAGLQTVWVNRNGRPREDNKLQPDFEIRALIEFEAILFR
jgi:putative hydrolase of the HAD superfamily